MKRFTILLTLVGGLALLAVLAARSEARAEAAKSASISPVYDSTGAMLDAIKPKAAAYRSVLGKSLEDNDVAEFVASNCSSAGQFQLCQNSGMALWVDQDQKVNTIYLYALGANGFAPYDGALPFGINAIDSMANVEQKLGQPVNHTGQFEPGLPDAGSSPDHIHFWAVYERFGVTIVYKTPFANDKNATIHAILVSQ